MSRKVAETCKLKLGIISSILKNVIIISLGSAVLSLAVWVGIKYLHIFLADPKFESMSKYSTTLCIWVVVSGAGQVITQHNLALHQESFYLWLAIIGGIIALSLGVTLVPSYGAEAVGDILLGVSVALISSEFARVIFIVKGRLEYKVKV